MIHRLPITAAHDTSVDKIQPSTPQIITCKDPIPYSSPHKDDLMKSAIVFRLKCILHPLSLGMFLNWSLKFQKLQLYSITMMSMCPLWFVTFLPLTCLKNGFFFSSFFFFFFSFSVQNDIAFGWDSGKILADVDGRAHEHCCNT